MFSKKDSVFDRINKHLSKKGHELVASIFLSDYNQHDIYIRFDYVSRISAYKISWIDLNFFDEKKMDDYISQQIVTKYLALKIVEKIYSIDVPDGRVIKDDIKGDLVEVILYREGGTKEFIFNRYLPIEWEFLIDIFALSFSYLPRSMEIFLNEIFAIFDGTEERYNALKPIKFDLNNGDDDSFFKSNVILKGTKAYEDGRVEFLEKIDNHYLAIVEDYVPNLVNIKEEDDGYVFLWCNCDKESYCQHIYATILAIRDKKFKPFYKVLYKGKDESLLEKVTEGKFFLCFGIEGDQLLLVTAESLIFKADIMVEGKRVFEVIEDDDDCSLSKALDRYE